MFTLNQLAIIVLKTCVCMWVCCNTRCLQSFDKWI